ncbi:MAG: hypothetical protein LBK13_09845 [Spirochaetales bacterium]|jgi:hypothetical protein|nr:hypothetical protein [Spirochaetales bacterium]
MLFDENIAIKKLLIIIDYETNKILNTDNLEINSNDMLEKLDMMIDLILSINIIKYYEPIISEYNI